jgi:hypothetical protein
MQPPADCHLGSVEIGGVNYDAYVPNGDGEYVILYGVSPEGANGFYRYDTREKTVQRYGLSTEGYAASNWAVLDPASHGIDTPEGYVLMDVIVDGEACRGFVPASGESTAYFVLYAQRGEEAPGLYTYDIYEGSYQRFGILKPVAETEVAPEEATEAQAELLAAQKQLRTARWLLVGIGAVLLASLAAVVILSVLLNRRNKY